MTKYVFVELVYWMTSSICSSGKLLSNCYVAGNECWWQIHTLRPSDVYMHQITGPVSVVKTVISGMSITKIRRPWGRLFFMMRINILISRRLYDEISAPSIGLSPIRRKTITWTIEKYSRFLSQNIWRCRLQNFSHFVQASWNPIHIRISLLVRIDKGHFHFF